MDEDGYRQRMVFLILFRDCFSKLPPPVQKINATNSWNFALIDYFHDMSLLRNTSDNSINFQRASCTLDGCVKIWTSRVDSVGTETGKLLGSLANQGRDDDDENSDNPDADPTQTKKKRVHRPAATLAKDPAQLRSKKLDLEFHVDPLFKKTCADFDEGGASGLLMNHLSLGSGDDALRIIFDAGDSKRKMEDDEEKTEEPYTEVSIDSFRKFISTLLLLTLFDHPTPVELLPELSTLDNNKEIAPSLSGFEFAGNSFSFLNAPFLATVGEDNDDDDDDDDSGPPVQDIDGANFGDNVAPVEDFFSGPDAVNDDFGGGMGGDDYSGNSDPPGPTGEEEGDGSASGPFVPFDPRKAPNQRDLVMAMADADENGTLDYFDKNFMKNWAGPEHWKVRTAIKKRLCSYFSLTFVADLLCIAEGDNNATKTKKKEKKEAFTIDFFKPLEKDLKQLNKELFAPVGKNQSINLPGTGGTVKKGAKKAVEKKNDHRLPDDMHFSSRQLVRLFLKPKFEVCALLCFIRVPT